MLNCDLKKKKIRIKEVNAQHDMDPRGEFGAHTLLQQTHIYRKIENKVHLSLFQNSSPFNTVYILLYHLVETDLTLRNAITNRETSTCTYNVHLQNETRLQNTISSKDVGDSL